jgi:serine protease Do
MNKALIKLFALGLILLPQWALALSGLPDFTELVQQNHKAVVNISTQLSVRSRSGQSERDRRLEEFERENRDPRERSPFEGSGMGSGFIISDDGFILTNNHVVDGADNILVRLHDRREFKAKLIGTDPQSDMAVLKIQGTNLPTVKIGNSDALKVGEWVLAIGSPFGFDFSVTAGIVSATGRALPNESYVPFIQTDVAINPGNSGGPLFNLQGEVIGINSQIYSRTGSFMGLSFAIPIELAMDVTNQLKTVGRVSRGWLGVHIQEVTMVLAESFGMSTAHGALVSAILPNSPASTSSLQVGDVITHFEGKRVDKSSSLPPMVGRVPVNTNAGLRVVREGKSIELTVNIGQLPGRDELKQVIAANDENALQMEVGVVTSDMREEYGVDKGGVVVTEVTENGPADVAGIVPGDIITTVDYKSVDSPAEFDEVVASLDKDRSIALLVHRKSAPPTFLALQIPK